MKGEPYIKIGLEFIVSIIVGIIIGVVLSGKEFISKDSVYWFFGAMIQAFSALLGLVGVIIAFRIQHIRNQLRDIQNAILVYSQETLHWGFAGFDMEEIEKRKDYLFRRLKEIYEKKPDSEDKKQSLEALEPEQLRFEKLLDNYKELDTERQRLYDKCICPMCLIIGTIVISILGLVLSKSIYSSGIVIFFGIVALSIWSIIRIGKFLIIMMLREKRIKVFISVDVKTKDKT